MLYEVLLVVDLLVAIALVGLILVQQGKGADMGASFGGGGSNTVFGASGSGNFLTRTTAVLATIFFIVSLVLGNLSASKEAPLNEFEGLEVPVAEAEVVPGDSDVPALATENTGSDVPAATEEEPKQDSTSGDDQ
ncbi:MAG: preprotein translocase subunit SecG [Aestuariibacter sp.]